MNRKIMSVLKILEVGERMWLVLVQVRQVTEAH
jgi:hypothetical protein